jgi:hypothetical protein
MKTKKLIKLLQEADPTGEGYVRINSEPILFCEPKEGYWDGPYNYLEKTKDGKYIWVESTKGYKIDIRTIDMFDFIDRFDGNLEEVKKHIKVEYTYLDDEREKAFMESVEKTCKEYNEIIEKINKKHGNKRI